MTRALFACALALLLPALARAQEPPEPPRALSLRVAAGAGLGMVGFERPTAAGSQQLPASAFAASELALELHAWPTDAFSLAVQLIYQTSLGLELRIPPQFAVPEDVSMRLQRAELSAAPVIALGDSRSVALAFPAGISAARCCARSCGSSSAPCSRCARARSCSGCC